MEKSKSETFILSVNDFGQKIYTSQSEPNKKYILDEEGNMIEYQPEKSICAVQLNSQNRVEEESNDTSYGDRKERLSDSSSLAMMNSLDSVTEFEENLMNELDSDFMSMVPNPQSQYIMQHMDIREPLTKLRKLIENRLGVKLQGYVFALQGVQILEDHINLVDQCVQGEGLVQVNVQVQTNLKRINIIDVLKPAEDYIHVDDEDLDDISEKDDLKRPTARKELHPKSIVHWHVDYNYKKEQERLKIPSDPVEWSTLHVRHWLQWAVRQFNLPNIKLNDWSMDGKALQELTMQDFQKIVPSDPGDVFWTHLELLRKMKVIAVKKEDFPKKVRLKDYQRIRKNSKPSPKKDLKILNYSTTLRYFDTPIGSTTRIGNTGQIQLWQFLLELLTTKEYTSIIQWIGAEGEFKLNHPEVVANLWGERKNKPQMNYEKLSRALRYYYDGDMICKVHGKRFVYKFVCDLKQLLGYSAIDLAHLVQHGRPSPART